MKNKLAILALIVVTVFGLTGCGAIKNSLGKMGRGMSVGDYTVTVWSGGEAVRTYEIVNGFVNTEDGTDGWYFISEGKMVRVAGTVTVEQK